MISILIPVYNIDCTPLVNKLILELQRLNNTYEIICIDDASKTSIEANRLIRKQNNVHFIELDKNIGRSKIRNLLVSKASYDWLLFLDADTLPVQDNYLESYLFQIKNNKEIQVFSGGLSYRKQDLNKNNHLRYYYGINRESKDSSTRNQSPYASLLFSNTLIQKSIFEKIHFSDTITQYGHEDSLFSYELKQNKIRVYHIHNPVYHTGIEDNVVFIKKTKIAIENLWDLYTSGIFKPEMNRLLTWFLRLKKVLLTPIFTTIYKLFNRSFEKRLSKNKPSLLLFDIYKLSYLCYISNKKAPRNRP